jgi:predicted deacylase
VFLFYKINKKYMKNKIISKKSISKEFNFLRKSEYLGAKGIIRIDSGKPGPVFGLTICTHGNEIAGLAAVSYLRNKYNIRQKLLKGSIVIVVNNLKAAEKALKAKTETGRLKSRYIDLNFNRLPKDLLKITGDSRYEVNRAKDLLPIWNMFDVALDIHSTIQDNPPMIIASDNLDYSLVKGFPIKTVISNIVKVQIGAPAFSFYGGKKKIQTVEIESGQHDKVSSQAVAVKSILSLLKELRMIKGKNKLKRKIFEEYYVYDSVIFPNKKAVLIQVFKDFSVVEKGEVIATINNKKVKANEDSCILMAPKGVRPVKVGEEAVFLSKPVNKKII